jgi:hypothetical protein
MLTPDQISRVQSATINFLEGLWDVDEVPDANISEIYDRIEGLSNNENDLDHALAVDAHV